MFFYLIKKYTFFFCLFFFHYLPRSLSFVLSITLSKSREHIAGVGRGIKCPADSSGMILGHHAPFPPDAGMNMHWHPVIEVPRQLEPVTWQISPESLSIIPPLPLLCVVCNSGAPGREGDKACIQTYGDTQISPFPSPRCGFFFHLKVTKQGARKKEKELSLSFVCHSPWQLSFQAFKMQRSPHKALAQLCTSLMTPVLSTTSCEGMGESQKCQSKVSI